MTASDIIEILEYIQEQKQGEEIIYRILDEIGAQLVEMECTLREIKERLDVDRELPF